jgi:hypothetical protein
VSAPVSATIPTVVAPTNSAVVSAPTNVATTTTVAPVNSTDVANTAQATQIPVQVSQPPVSGGTVQSDGSQKNGGSSRIIDPAILNDLQEAIERNEEYVSTIMQQLQYFLPEEEIAAFEQLLQVKAPTTTVYAIAYELQEHAQAIIDVLKQSSGKDMGDDAAILDHLINDLIAYWQSYTQSLADGIDASVRFCNTIHLVEQFIVNWLDRSLLCV